MLELAQVGGFIESQAQAFEGLGQAACANRDKDDAKQYWSTARDLYEHIGQTDKMTSLAGELDDIITRGE